jgi:hypothetical protein
MSIEIHTTPDTDQRLWALVRSVKTEIGGWGYAFQQDDGDFEWSSVFLVPQVASASEVDFESTDGDVVAIEKALADGVLDDPRFCWVSWHSHHTMKAFWSSTDDKRIAAMHKAGVKKLLSFVGCHDGEYKMRLDVFDVEAHGINISQVTLSDVKLIGEVDSAIAAEVKANLRSRPKQQWQRDFKQAINSYDLDVAFTVRDLMDEGLTHNETLDFIEEHGIEGAAALLNGDDFVAPWELADADSLAALMVGDD